MWCFCVIGNLTDESALHVLWLQQQNHHKWLLEAVLIINFLLITSNHFQLNKSCPHNRSRQFAWLTEETVELIWSLQQLHSNRWVSVHSNMRTLMDQVLMCALYELLIQSLIDLLAAWLAGCRLWRFSSAPWRLFFCSVVLHSACYRRSALSPEVTVASINWPAVYWGVIDQRVAAVTGAGAAEPVVLSGQMIITEGAVFSDELSNSSSLLFKSLAFDVENLVRSQAFILKTKRCRVHHPHLLWKRKENNSTKPESKSKKIVQSQHSLFLVMSHDHSLASYWLTGI